MKKLFAGLIGLLFAGVVHAGGPLIEDKVQYGEDWPFTVEQVVIGCEAGLPYVKSQGKYYALTGAAQQKWPAVAPIHVVGKSVYPFIQLALGQCD